METMRCAEDGGCAIWQEKPVPGDGPARAKIMFVGESPTTSAQNTGRPFVGPAGDILDSWLRYLALNRDDVYLTNVVKCPRKRERAVEQRGLHLKNPAFYRIDSPSDEQLRACAQWLSHEIQRVAPKVIVLMGGVAQKRFVSRTLPGCEDVAFQVWESYPSSGNTKTYRGITYFTLVHPSNTGRPINSNSPDYLIQQLDRLRQVLSELF